MKRPALLFIALLLFQCSKDEPAAPSSNMTASVDGQPWQMGAWLTRVILDGNQLFIEGHESGTGKFLEVYVANAVVGMQTATGRTTGQIATCYVRYGPPSEFPYYTSFTPVANAGQVTITEIDLFNKTVSGTFSGSLTRLDPAGVAEVTDGVFTKMKYEEACLICEIDEAPQNLAFFRVGGNLRMFAFAGEGYSTNTLTHIYFSDGADYLELHFPENMAIGDYVLGPIGSTDYSMSLAGEESISGTLSITRVGDGRIEATFSFTTSSMTVTEGVLGHTF